MQSEESNFTLVQVHCKAAPWLLRAGMETALQEGYRQVGEGAEESDQDGGGSGGV